MSTFLRLNSSEQKPTWLGNRFSCSVQRSEWKRKKKTLHWTTHTIKPHSQMRCSILLTSWIRFGSMVWSLRGENAHLRHICDSMLLTLARAHTIVRAVDSKLYWAEKRSEWAMKYDAYGGRDGCEFRKP